MRILRHQQLDVYKKAFERETQTWLEFAVRCKYADRDTARSLFKQYNETIAMIVSMINNPEKDAPVRAKKKRAR